MNTIIRKFNDNGIIAFEQLLSEFKDAKKIDTLKLNSLIEDENLSSELDNIIELPRFANNKKLIIAKTITEALQLNKNKVLYYDKGVWTWLSAYLLEHLVPFFKGTSERDFKEKALYILDTENWNRYYRHLLAFPCWIYAELEEKGKIFLRGEIYDRGEIVEQLASVQDIQRNTSIVEAATILFYNSKTDNIYKGAASKNRGGTARRFREVIQQFKVTFDLNAMNGSQIVGILPFEFDIWKEAS